MPGAGSPKSWSPQVYVPLASDFVVIKTPEPYATAEVEVSLKEPLWPVSSVMTVDVEVVVVAAAAVALAAGFTVSGT